MDNLPGERWKSIEGYEDFYQVSSHGRIKSLSRPREAIHNKKRGDVHLLDKELVIILLIMGYQLHAFICTQHNAILLTSHFSHAINVHLDKELSLIPMTEQLFDQINQLQVSDGVDKFEYLTSHVERRVLEVIDDKKFAYIEAEYFGGEGGQIAIVWNNCQRESFFAYGQDCINKVLKNFGVRTIIGNDEFDTLELGRHRNTAEWI